MKLYPGVSQPQSLFGGSNLFQYFFIGDWPKDSWTLTLFPTEGHMDRLEQLGKARPIRGSRPIKWQLA